MIEEPTQQHLEVDGVRVYATLEGGLLSCMVRATDKATFDAQALAVGLKVYKNPEQPAVVDPETLEVITPAVPASGPLIAAPCVTITEIGAHTLVPATYDAEGNEVTAPVLDNRYHANFWLGPRLVERGLWKQWALAWSLNGDQAIPNSTEEAIVLQGIELVDPATVNNPVNVML